MKFLIRRTDPRAFRRQDSKFAAQRNLCSAADILEPKGRSANRDLRQMSDTANGEPVVLSLLYEVAFPHLAPLLVNGDSPPN
jgi:hypothetical protein